MPQHGYEGVAGFHGTEALYTVEIHERQSDIEGSYFLLVATAAPFTCEKRVSCPTVSAAFVSFLECRVLDVHCVLPL